MARLVNVIFALDCFLFALATLGGSYPSESFSSAAFRGEAMGQWYGLKARPAIDWLFSWLGQKDHCKKAYFNAKLNLPPEER